MMTPYQSLENENSIVYETEVTAMAAAVCTQLQLAGILARLCEKAGSAVVAVPAESALESAQLLHSDAQHGEIYYFKG